jgi:hypothetical protein
MVWHTADNRTYLALNNILTQIRPCGWTSDTLIMLSEITRLFDINRELQTPDPDWWSNLPVE